MSGLATPWDRTRLHTERERADITAALLGEGPEEQVRNALMLVGALGYLLKEDLGTEERGMLDAIERRLGVALQQLHARAAPPVAPIPARQVGAR